MRKLDDRGFSLLELLIALTIVAALVTMAFAGLRVGLSAWQQGENRAEVHQHLRSLAFVLSRTLGATYPYHGAFGEAPESVVLFRGAESRIEFVTQAAAFPFSRPIAFTATVIAYETEGEPGLVLRQRALPNRDPFTEAAVAMRDPTVTNITFRYLDETGTWLDSWDTEDDSKLPRAIRFTLGTNRDGRVETLPPFIVSLRSPPQ